MAIIAGIDEAGLGPILGPLVVSGVVFRVRDEDADLCLWDALRDVCTKKPAKTEHRLVIADSKQLYHSKLGLAGLERAALCMLDVRRQLPKTFRGLLEVLCPVAIEEIPTYPWYANCDFDLPHVNDCGDVSLRANALRRVMDDHHVVFSEVMSEPVLEGRYNKMVKMTDNKSTVLMTQALKLIYRIARNAGEEPAHIFVDRLGGRSHYREPLMTALPGMGMAVIEESNTRSAYELSGSGNRRCRIEFLTKGDALQFPIALASIYSKYLRELFMHAFNGYFVQHQANLTPTAGYYTDAKRWLDDARNTLDELRIERDLLIRSR